MGQKSIQAAAYNGARTVFQCIDQYCTQTKNNVNNQTIYRFFLHCAPETIRSATDTLLCGDWAYMCMVPSVHGERILDLWFHFQNMSGT